MGSLHRYVTVVKYREEHTRVGVTCPMQLQPQPHYVTQYSILSIMFVLFMPLTSSDWTKVDTTSTAPLGNGPKRTTYLSVRCKVEPCVCCSARSSIVCSASREHASTSTDVKYPGERSSISGWVRCRIKSTKSKNGY